jgi:hypothetical protein
MKILDKIRLCEGYYVVFRFDQEVFIGSRSKLIDYLHCLYENAFYSCSKEQLGEWVTRWVDNSETHVSMNSFAGRANRMVRKIL